MTAEELAKAGKDGLIKARAALLIRYKATPDASEKQQIADAVDMINDLMTRIELADLATAAQAVGAAADELEKVIGTAKMQPFGRAFQAVVDALTNLDSLRAKAHVVDALPKATSETPTIVASPPAASSASPPSAPAPTPSPDALPPISNAKGFVALRDEYAAYYEACVPRPERATNIQYYLGRLAVRKATYVDAAGGLGIPWYFVGILHGMESGFDFATHLHNGDPLTARTVQKPPGRPVSGTPPFSWQESARDALLLKKLDAVSEWSVPQMLFQFEHYNGRGYRSMGKTSPYLWSFSNLFTKGKYVADNKYDPDAESRQCGAGVILKVGKQHGLF